MKNKLAKRYSIVNRLLVVVIFSTVLMGNIVQAQVEGKIHYVETKKLNIEIEGLDESMMSMIPQSQEFKKALFFNDKETLYKSSKGEVIEDSELESDDGSLKIMIMYEDTEELLYFSHGDKKRIQQRGIMGRSFVVEETMQKKKWKITNEKIKYLGYECTKAVIENEEEFIVAWFSTEIGLPIGPSGFYGLPGAILMINVDDGELEIRATKVSIEALGKGAISIPSEGKRVSEQEFSKIQKERESELKKSFQGGRQN